MKTLIILSIFVTLVFSNNNKQASVENFRFMFEKIGEKRVGVHDAKVDSIIIPFEKPIKPKKPINDEEEIITESESSEPIQEHVIITSYNLQAIMDKRAKISGKWYKLDDEIDDYKIVSIKDGIVWLQNSVHKKRLTIRKKNEKITIK